MFDRTSLPEFHRAYVVSDLHLGGEQGFQMFSEDDAFEAFCRNISSNTSAEAPTLLLINGDFVDFLAEPHASYWNGDSAERMLVQMAARPQLSGVFQGLKRFVAKAGAKLVITLGNHDLELSRFAVRQQLISLLTDNTESRGDRIEFAFDGWGYRFQVGGRVALATHGNEVDEFNFTRYDILNQIIREEQLFGGSGAARGWKPSAGSVFVVDAINHIKSQFPFVDLLKPETLVLLSLSILSPKHLRYVDEALEVQVSARRNEMQRPSSERRFLRGSNDPLDMAPSNRTGLGRLSSTTKARLIEERTLLLLRDQSSQRIDEVIYGLDDQFLGGPEWYARAKSAVGVLIEEGVELFDATGKWIGDRLSDTAKNLHAKALSTALSPHLAVDAFSPEVLDDFDRRFLSMIRAKYDVVFTGHTHVRRFAECSQLPGASERLVTFYINTGTWAGVMRLFPEDVHDSTAFMPIYNMMTDGNREGLVKSRWVRQERPVAIVEKLGKKQVRLQLSRIDDNGNFSHSDLDGRSFTTTFTNP